MRNVKIYLVLFSSLYFAGFCSAETPSLLKVNLCDKKYNGQNKKPNICCGINKSQIPKTSIDCKPYNKDIDKFRQEVVYLHNYYRNSSATHRDDNTTATRTGSDINAVSYDLDLEYLAWCNAARCNYGHDWQHDVPGRYKNVGQNIGMQGFTRYEVAITKYPVTISNWWTENTLMLDGVLDHFNNTWKKPGTTRHIGHYTQLVWWSVTHIGCARATFRVNKLNNMYLVCNYGSTISPSNVMGWPVYGTGPPCTTCKNEGTKCCNKEFPGLCGQVAPIPTGWTPPDEIPAKRRRRESNLTFQEGEAQTTTAPEPAPLIKALAQGVRAPDCPAGPPPPAPGSSDSKEVKGGSQAIKNVTKSTSGATQISFHSANFIVFVIFVFGTVILY